MANSPVNFDPPVDGDAIALSPRTFDRFDDAAKYVEGVVRTRAPWPSDERFPGIKPGAWGLLEPGDTITAGSGLTLGSGIVTLCTQDDDTLVPSDLAVTVYNSGPEIAAAAYSYGDHGVVVRLAWTEAGWAVSCQAGAGSYY